MDKKDTRTQIVEAALNLFWQISYHGTNMNDLSREAGLNKATVYQHFRSKEEIALAAIQYGVECTHSTVFQIAFDTQSDPIKRLKEIHKRSYENHISYFKQTGICRGCPFVNIGSELATTSEEVRQEVQKALNSFLPFYRSIIEELDKKGILKHKISIEELAKDLQDNMNAAMIDSKIQNRPEVILEAGERAVRYLT